MKKIFIISCLLLGLFGLWQIKLIVFAEQSGSSPESGTSSRLKTAYDWLFAKGANYGATDAADWNSTVTYPWGTMWNRIMESAAWEPDGTAEAGNILNGLTFYAGNGDRTQKTGTMTDREGDSASSAQLALAGVNYFTPLVGFYDGDDRVSATDAQVAALDTDLITGNVKSGINIFGISGNSNVVDTSTGDAVAADILLNKKAWVDGAEVTGVAAAAVDYSKQQYVSRDDYGGPNGSGGAEDYQGEESTWSSSVTNVWKDTRTGVYWSSSQGSKPNEFTLSDCDFFNTTKYPLRASYPGDDIGVASAQCGPAADAINFCATLDFGGYTDWYLPSQKELQQAYIDGMYNQAGTTLTNAAAFTTAGYFWSSTERSNDSTNAWVVNLYYGNTNGSAKTSSYAVRCVRRD